MKELKQELGRDRDHCCDDDRRLRPTAYGVDNLNRLIVFDIETPGVLISMAGINGLQPGETILAIAVRPANGLLYGVGSSSRLYLLSADGNAAAVNGAPFVPLLVGTNFGLATNPVVDALRLVSDAGSNWVLNFNTGAVTVQTALSTGGIVSAAYTNSFAGATSTNLFTLDTLLNRLNLQAPPGSGVQTPFNTLTLAVVTPNSGFDIHPRHNVGYVVVQVGTQSTLNKLDILTGQTRNVGLIGDGQPLRAFALAAVPNAPLFCDTNSD